MVDMDPGFGLHKGLQECPAIVSFALAIIALVFGSPARATEVYAKREDVACETCHDNPAGGGPRNLVGLYYDATGVLRPDRAQDDVVDEMGNVVQQWLQKVAATPPGIVWRYTPLDELETAPAPSYSPVSDTALLRRISLDLRSDLPDPADVQALIAGRTSIDSLVDAYLDSKDFYWTMRLYHRDIVRPRTGIFNQSASLTRISRIDGPDGKKVWRSNGLMGEEDRGFCDAAQQVSVFPYWDRSSAVPVCARTASTHRHPASDPSIDCATTEGQQSGYCGCGPHLVWCYRSDDYDRVKKSMRQEGGRIADYILRNDRSYTELVTADWTMWNGRLEHFYARLDGNLGELTDANVERSWRRVERGPEHSGVLSTHMYLNYFYNGRRWAQRTFESFLCHETVPDFELLDEIDLEHPISYRTHPEAMADVNVNSGRACAACHLQLDGLSRVKDRWDNFGQYYETGYGGVPVPQSAIFLGEEVDGLAAFGDALGASEVFADCAANQLWEHLTGHRFRPEETRLRRELVAGFIASDHNFRELVRTMVKTEVYRDVGNLKTMERELYQRSLDSLLSVEWDVGSRDGFDRYYDKVGGMDYRRIESRDRTASPAYAMVQYKAAAEMCSGAMEASQTPLLAGVDPTESPDDARLDGVIGDWFLRTYVRPWDRVTEADRRLFREVFRKVEAREGARQGYMAMCTVMLASEDFALY